MPGPGVSVSVGYEAITFRDELVQVDLFGTPVASVLHTVEVDEFPSGLQDPLRQGESFSKFTDRVCL